MICLISGCTDISPVTLMIICAETLCHSGMHRNDTGCIDQCTRLSGNLYVCFAVDLTLPYDLFFGNFSADRLFHFLYTDIDMSVNTFGLHQPHIPAGDSGCMRIPVFNAFSVLASAESEEEVITDIPILLPEAGSGRSTSGRTCGRASAGIPSSSWRRFPRWTCSSMKQRASTARAAGSRRCTSRCRASCRRSSSC